MAKIAKRTIEIFDVIDDVKDLSQKEKLNIIKEYFQKKYQGKTVTYEILDKKVEAIINATTRNEFKKKGEKETWNNFKVRINIGASNEFMTLIQNASYLGSAEEKKRKQNRLHHNTNKWHYFTKPIICDGVYYSVHVDVREDNFGIKKVYSVTLGNLGEELIKQMKNETSVSVLKDTESSAHLVNDSILGDSNFVNYYNEEKEDY